MKINKDDLLKIILGLSFLVLLVVIAMSGSTSKNNKNTSNNNSNKPIVEEQDKNKTDNDKQPQKTIYDKLNQNNYSFVITLNVNNLEKNITGKVSDSTIEVTIDSQTIIRNISEFDNIDEDFKYINLEYIKRIIDLANINSKDEENNIIIYDVDVIDLLDIYNPDIEYDSFTVNEVDKITATFVDEYLKKVEIDYTNYFKYIDKNNNNLNITIEYNY